MTPDANAARRVLARAEAGKSIDSGEAEVLLGLRGEDLDRLIDAAGTVRDRGLESAGRPRTVTYSRKVFIPLTRLCRDRCHYCTFATTPQKLDDLFLDIEQVVAIAGEGAKQGCKEALFTLGDQPEERWPEARDWLDARGYSSTLEYLRAAAIAVLERTGLLPHLNPGVMSWQDLGRLKPVAPSMGLMLETSSRRLFEEKGQPHFGSPDKDPAVRLRCIEDAGRHSIPFTTGLLIGIGETPGERVQSLLDLRRLAREYRHIQEVLIQNFRAKPGTAMRDVQDADSDDYVATIAVARLLLGPSVRIQAPPNLSDPHRLTLLLRAGVDDWGGVSPVTPDHVNPERPWPELADLAQWSAGAGYELVERLSAHPEYVRQGEPWIDPRVLPHVMALANAEGLATAGAIPAGREWQEPDAALDHSVGRVELHVEIDAQGRTLDRRGDFNEVYGDWNAIAERAHRHQQAPVTRLPSEVASALRSAERSPASLSEHDALTLMTADGDGLRAVVALADSVRRDVVGDDVTFVVNRNINFTNICYVGCRFCAFAQRRTDADAYTLSLEDIAARATEAADLGATEVCIQGGIHPDLPGDAYWEIAAAVRAAAPDMHIHAFSPMEVVNGATRTGLSIREWLIKAREHGVGSHPGTAAEILDDEIRWVLTKGKLPTAAWIEVVRTAHELGIPTTATMMYGHVDHPRHWVAHLKLIASLQTETGGFTEFVPLPFVHQSSPIYLAGVARTGPTQRDNLAVHALARLLLHGGIDNIQASWVKLGVDGCREVLHAGVNDLGGTLMEETISRMAGSQHGSRKSVQELAELVAPLGRPLRQRTTLYGTPAASAKEGRQPAAARI